jgi:hypothetical protein
MRKKYGKALSWILFVVLIVGAFAALWFWQRATGPKAPAESAPVATPVPQVPGKPSKGFAQEVLTDEEKAVLDNDAMNKAMRSGQGCEAIAYDPTLRQQCLDTLLFNQAMQTNDENACLQIADKSMQADCLNRVYLALALKNSDQTLCEKIANDKMKQQCEDTFLAASGRTATSAKDCDPIKDDKLKQTCLDEFGFSQSVKTLDVASCDQIQDPELKARCSKTVTSNLKSVDLGKKLALGSNETTEQTLKGCDSLSGDAVTRCQNQANFKLAAEKKDLSYCGKITDSATQKNCMDTQSVAINSFYLRIATAKKDPTLCAKILDDELRASCQTYAQ